MNGDIIKQAAALIPGGSSLSQDDREAAARAILAFRVAGTVDAIKRQINAEANKLLFPEITVGPQTAERVFKAAGLTDLSDLQAVMDAVERALVSEGVPVAWLYEDDLPDNYPYDAMFPYSKVEGVRMFPVYGPSVTIKPLEWKRGEYVSSAKSIDTLAFTAQFIGDGDDGWMLHTYLTNETKRTRHPTRQAAEDAAQSLHNAEVAKYLSG